MNDRHQIAPYPLRMPAELRARLEDEARKIGRSLHAEIVQRLEQTLSALPAGNDPEEQDLKFQLLAKTLDLSQAAEFALAAKQQVASDLWDMYGMKYFVKKYRLPPDVEATLEQEYYKGQSDLIKALLMQVKPKG